MTMTWLSWPRVMEFADWLDRDGYRQLAREARKLVWDEALRLWNLEVKKPMMKVTIDRNIDVDTIAGVFRTLYGATITDVEHGGDGPLVDVHIADVETTEPDATSFGRPLLVLDQQGASRFDGCPPGQWITYRVLVEHVTEFTIVGTV